MRKTATEFLWFGILLALILIMGYLLISGNVLLFIAPRMVPMAWFGLAVLIALFFYQALHIVRMIRRKEMCGAGKIGMLIFLVPVVLIATVMPDAGTTGSLPNQTVKIIATVDADETELAAQTERMETEQAGDMDEADDRDTKIVESEDIDTLGACELMEETAYFNASEDAFSGYLQAPLEELLGKTVTVYGFVYVDNEFPEDTVLVARTMVTCCAADAAIVGFHVKVDPTVNLTANEWVRVTGTIHSARLPYYGEYYDFPVMTDGIILRCDTPDAEDAYLYP